MHAGKMYQALLDDYKCSKPVIYAGELAWHDALVSIQSDTVQEEVSVGTLLEDQPQPFGEMLKLTASELYLDILPIVSNLFCLVTLLRPLAKCTHVYPSSPAG